MDRHTVARYWSEGADPPGSEVGEGERLRARPGHRRGEGGAARDDEEGGVRVPAPYAQRPAAPRVRRLHRMVPEDGAGFGAAAPEAHPRFETPPGRQLQFDWKEDVRMVDANGEVLEFNVFTATLGYSRRHVFIPTPGRTTDDLLACLLQTFRVLGGVPEELVTDC